MAATRDGRLAYVGCDDGRIRIVDLTTGRLIRAVAYAHKRCIVSLHLSGDEQWLLSGGSEDKNVRLWDLADGFSLKRTFDNDDTHVAFVRISPDRSRVLAAGEGGRVIVWDARTGKELCRLGENSRHSNEVMAEFSRDGKTVAASSSDGPVHLWDAESGGRIRSFVGHSRPCHTLAFSPDGAHLFTGSFDGTFRVWQLATGQELARAGHESPTNRAALRSPNDWGAVVTSSGSSDRLTLWAGCRAADPRTPIRLVSFSAKSDAAVDAKQAQAFYRRAADEGNPLAQWMLGMMYLGGVQVTADKAEAERWLTRAAENGVESAQAELANCYLGDGGFQPDGAKAYLWAKRAADNDDDRGQLLLGICHYRGAGTGVDQGRAVELFRKSVDGNNTTAMLWLAYCHVHGTGVAADRAEAVRWLRRAEASGNTQAKDLLRELGESVRD